MGGEKYKCFAYIGIVVFTVSVIYFIVSVYAEMVKGESQTQTIFTEFVQHANINSYMTLQSPDELENYFNQLEIAVTQNSHISAVLFTIDQNPVFAFPASSNVLQISDANQPVLIGSSPMLKTYSMALPGQNGQSAVLSAVLYVLRPQDIYSSARVSFLIILAYTLVLIVVIVYVSLGGERASTTMRLSPRNIENTTSSINERETIPVVFKEQESSWDSFFVGIENDLEKTKAQPAPLYDSYKTEEKVTEDAPFERSFVEDYVNEESEIKENEIDSTVPQVNDPMGLFSDITGVGWESYLETRLDSELIRAASSEQDLALVFVQIKGIENNIPVKKKIATLLLDYFKYRDFVFEHLNDSFAGIMLDMNLDQSMILTEELHAQLKKLLRNEGLNSRIGIGLSTRALRILPGSRIITEATEAVARAFEEEDVPIVAFRVSPEKYRQYVSNSPV